MAGVSAGNSMAEWQFMSTEDAANVKLFEEFYDAFTGCAPAKTAQTQEDLSTVHPAHYLAVSRRRARDAAPKEHDPLPPFIRRLVNLQGRDGRWARQPEVEDCFDGLMPDPPAGVSDWRWVTAVVLALLRRYPEHYAITRRAYEAAAKWVTDETLASKARDALPPIPCAYPLDRSLVKSRQWRQAQQQLTDEGYAAFMVPTDTPATLSLGFDASASQVSAALPATPSASEAAPNTNTLVLLSRADAIRKAKHKKGLETEWELACRPADSRVHLREEVRTLWRRKGRWGAPEVGDELHPARVVGVGSNDTYSLLYLNQFRETEHLVPRQHIIRRGEPGFPIESPQATKPVYLQTKVDKLAATWATPLTYVDELARVSRLRRHPKPPPVWNDRHHVQSADSRPHSRSGLPTAGRRGHDDVPPEAPSPTVLEMDEIARLEAEIDDVLARERIAKKDLRRHGLYPRYTQSYRRKAGGNVETSVDRAAAEHVAVVQAILQHETCVRSVMTSAIRGAQEFRTAETLAQKQDAFVETTACLKRTRVAALEVVDAVHKWNAGDVSKPFLWNSTSIMLTLLASLDFLQTVPELVDWYGNDYPYIRNPFAMNMPVDARPSTPKGSKRLVVIDGQEAEVVVPRLEQERLQALAAVDAYQVALYSGAAWWPGFGMAEDELLAVRAAEKILLETKRAHQQQAEASLAILRELP